MRENGLLASAAVIFKEWEDRWPYLRYLRLQKAFDEYFDSDCRLALARKLCRLYRSDDFNGRLQLCVLLGRPINYSLSPLIHNMTADFYGQDDLYFNAALEAEEAEAFLREWSEDGASPLRGANVTRPYKEVVYKRLSERAALTEAAENIGAVNTVFWRDGRLCGDNTDFSGWYRGWKTEGGGELESKRAAVFGAGGAARAILYALIINGIAEICVINSAVRGRRLIEHFRKAAEVLNKDVRFSLAEKAEDASEYLEKCDIFIQATPVGQRPAADATVYSWPELGRAAYEGKTACDLVYNPVATRFLREAAALGMKTVSGASMLICQAYEARRKFYGLSDSIGGRGPEEQLYRKLQKLFV
ncbi:hypothetical protein IJT93_02030 [bacterium]|nr:hypothetical protein [bacterium]